MDKSPTSKKTLPKSLSDKALHLLGDALPASPQHHRIEKALVYLSNPQHEPSVYSEAIALLRKGTEGKHSRHLASLAEKMRSLNPNLVKALLADQDLYNLEEPDLTIVLSKCARYGGDLHREDIVSKHATPKHLPNSEHRSSVYSSVIQYGNDNNRQSVLKKATLENFSEQDLSALYTAISQYGNDADRDALFPLVKALPGDVHRSMVLCSIAQHGNDTQRGKALSLATSEHMSDEWARSRVLCAGAKHGTGAQRDMVMGQAEQLSTEQHYRDVLCTLALHGDDAQREKVRSLATEQKSLDSATRTDILNCANRTPYEKSKYSSTSSYDFAQYSRSGQSSSYGTQGNRTDISR